MAMVRPIAIMLMPIPNPGEADDVDGGAAAVMYVSFPAPVEEVERAGVVVVDVCDELLVVTVEGVRWACFHFLYCALVMAVGGAG